MKEERNVVSGCCYLLMINHVSCLTSTLALFVQACEVPQLLQNVEQSVALILARAGFEKRLIDLGLSG